MATPRRSDARRNRGAILRVAGEALVTGTTAPPLPEIARRAGVAQATVYRHFSDRGTLAVAVMREQVAALAEVVEQQAGDPAAFRDLLRCVLTSQAQMRPLVSLLRELPARERRRHASRLIASLRVPFRRAQAAGLVRPDLEPGDLVLVLAMLESAVATATALDPAGRDDAVARVVATIVDGVCPPAR